jgi:hypothetical protein
MCMMTMGASGFEGRGRRVEDVVISLGFDLGSECARKPQV